MKQVFVFAILFCFFNARLWAQVPQSFQYQAIARDKDQKSLAGATLEVEVKILRNGTEVFSETHGDVKTASTGLFVLAVGSKEPADFSTINWALSGYSLKVSTTGALVLDLPPSPILSVPYALMAEEVRTEKQQLTLSNGNVLSISGGNSVTLPTGGQNLQPGTGIDITNNTIINKGDVNPNDDVLKTDAADGDVTGTFGNLQIKPAAIGNTELANGAVTGNKIAQQGAAQGQVLKWNGTTWAPDNDLNTVGSGNTATAAPILGDGSAGNQVRLAPGNANGQVLKWDGTAWGPAADETGMGASNTYAAGPGISVTGSSPNFTINNTGDTNAADDLTTATNFGGDVSGTSNNLQINANAVGATEIANGAVTGAKIAQQNATDGQVLKWNAASGTWLPQNDIGGGMGDGWGSQTAVTGTTLTGNGTPASPLNLAQQGASNGQVLKWNATNSTWIPAQDLSASTLEDLLDVTTTGVTNGQVLQWNGTQWAPTSPKTYSAGAGITIDAQNKIINTAPDVPLSLLGGGATTVTGTYPNLTVTTPAAATYAAGTGISVTGSSPSFTINNTGDTNAADDLTNTSNAGGDITGTFSNLQIGANAVGTNEIANGSITAADLAAGLIPTTLPPSGAAGGDLSGTYPNPNVARIRGINVSTTAPTSGQIMRYNSTTQQWEPSTVSSSGWGLTGNAGTNSSVNFIGTTDNQPIWFRVNNQARMMLGLKGKLQLFDDGEANTSIGAGSGEGGFENVFIGNGAGAGNSSGSSNTYVGTLAGAANTTASSNTFIGYFSGFNTKTGGQNTFIGVNSGSSNASGNQNTFIGVGSGSGNSSGSQNTFVGNGSGTQNTIGVRNVFLGLESGFFNIDGFNNVFLGTLSGTNNTTGNRNCFTGDGAGFSNKTGSFNTYYGVQSGEFSTGNNNCFFGAYAGRDNTTGTGLICIGAGAQPSSNSLSNAVAIGWDSRVSSSNSARFSNTITSIGGNSNWVMTSDARIKTAITENIPGLAFIQKLRPVSYRYDIRRQNALLGITDTAQWEGKYDIEKMTFSGFIAQEVEQAARSIGYDFSGVDAPKNDKSLYGLRYAEFTVPLVKAVQEQQTMIEEQKRLIQALEARLSALEKTLPKDNNSHKGE